MHVRCACCSLSTRATSTGATCLPRRVVAPVFAQGCARDVLRDDASLRRPRNAATRACAPLSPATCSPSLPLALPREPPVQFCRCLLARDEPRSCASIDDSRLGIGETNIDRRRPFTFRHLMQQANSLHTHARTRAPASLRLSSPQLNPSPIAPRTTTTTTTTAAATGWRRQRRLATTADDNTEPAFGRCA